MVIAALHIRLTVRAVSRLDRVFALAHLADEDADRKRNRGKRLVGNVNEGNGTHRGLAPLGLTVRYPFSWESQESVFVTIRIYVENDKIYHLSHILPTYPFHAMAL